MEPTTNNNDLTKFHIGTQIIKLFITSQILLSAIAMIATSTEFQQVAIAWVVFTIMLLIIIKTVTLYVFDEYPRKIVTNKISRANFLNKLITSIKSINGLTVLATLILMFLLHYIVVTFCSLTGLTPQPNNELIKDTLRQAPLLMFFGSVFIAPICEELLYREMIPKLMNYNIIAFIASSSIFFFLHQPTGIFGYLSYGAITISLLLARLWGKSVINAIAVHVLWNLFVMVAQLMTITPQ